MTPDYRAMCAELLQELCCFYKPWDLQEERYSDAMKRARALLAEPPAEGPSELEQALTIPKLLALVEDLEGALLSAADSLEDWGSYVDSYYKAKHAFDADVANAKSHAQRARNVINGEDIIGEIDD